MPSISDSDTSEWGEAVAKAKAVANATVDFQNIVSVCEIRERRLGDLMKPTDQAEKRAIIYPQIVDSSAGQGRVAASPRPTTEATRLSGPVVTQAPVS